MKITLKRWQKQLLTYGSAVGLVCTYGMRLALAQSELPNTPLEKAFKSIKLSSPHLWESLAVLKDGTILIAGGWPNGSYAEIFDPKTHSFLPTEKLMYARGIGHSATLLNDGRVLIIGGRQDEEDKRTSDGTPCGTNVEVFDPRFHKFNPIGELSVCRWEPASVLLDNGKVMVFFSGPYQADNEPSTVDLFDPKTNKFTPVSTPLEEPYDFSVIKLNNGKLLITGRHLDPQSGVQKGLPKSVPFTQIYDSTNNTVQKVNVVISGKPIGILSNGNILFEDDTDLSEFNPKSEKLEPVGTLPEFNGSRSDQPHVNVGNDRFLFFTSISGNPPELPSFILYDARLRKVYNLGTADVGVLGEAVSLPDGKILFYGVSRDFHTLSLAYVFNFKEWLQQNTRLLAKPIPKTQ